jgi:transcriptional regulator with XRE-family HTH domain
MLVGDRLRALREQKHLFQGHIEKRTGLLRCYVSRVENGHTVPSVSTLEKWARALDVPLYQVFYEGENPPTPPETKANGLWGSNGADSRFLMQMRRALSHTNKTDRQLLLMMARKLAKGRAAWEYAIIRKLLVASSATATPTPVTASPSALTSAPSTAVAATTFTWPGFIDYHIAAHKVLAVQRLNGAASFLVVVDFNEAKATRLARELVRH